MKRMQITVNNLHITIDESLNNIFIGLEDKMPGDMQVIEDDAILYSGNIDNFIKIMTKTKKKFGHLYR